MSSSSENKPKRRVSGRPTNNSKNREKPTTGVVWKRASEAATTEDIDEADQCIICADRIEYAAISPCTHTTCHVCTFRQRALYGKRSCLICRTENARIIITEQIYKKFDDFSQKDFVSLSDEYGIDFTSSKSSKDTLALLDFVCPVKYCTAHQDLTKFRNFKKLNEHVKNEHERHFCEICALNKKAFISELKLYQYRELQKHKAQGDDDGFKGHPACQFCTGKRFYSEDELFVHLREKHEKCHVCDQIDSSNPQYFKNYESLSEHFRDEHYVCNVQTCLDQKFVVFRDDFDLKAHMIKEHKNLFGGDKNLLSIGNIGYSNPRRNGFGSQLSTVSVVSNNNNNNNNNSINNNRNGYNRGARQTVTDEDETEVDSTELKKMRLEERARHYLNYDTAAVARFKVINKQFENYKLEADQLLKSYQEIFNKSSREDLAILIYELSELFEANSIRRKRLMEINRELTSYEESNEEQFPALPGSSSNYTFTGGTWNRPKNGISARQRLQEDFPALPVPEMPLPINNRVLTYKRIIPVKREPIPVVRRSSPDISKIKQSYLSGSTQSKGSSSSKPKAVDEEAFPALPKVTVKKPPRVNPIRTDSGVWGESSRNSTNLSGPSSSSTSNNSSSLDLSGLDDALPKAGGKKKKKQLLFHVGI